MWSIFYILAGIGVMLIGVKLLSSGMQQLLGNKLRVYVSRLTKNKVVSTGFATVSTFAMQSSTATTIMTVGFVGAGVLTLLESLPMIIGANIGAALTHLILCFSSFNIKLIFAGLGFVGAIMYMMKKPIVKRIGMVISGLGLLFAGLTVIGDGMNSLVASVPVAEFFKIVQFAPLLILIGILACIATQSSLSTIAIVISLMSVGALSFNSACYILYGINIGTCITALLVAFAYNTDSKRSALFHILFNVILTVIFTTASLLGFTKLFEHITSNFALNLIILDLFVNIFTACILLPFTKPLTKLLRKIIKTRKTSLENKWSIDEHSFETPSLALRILNENVHRAFLELVKNYELVKAAIFERRGKEIVQEENRAEDFKRITDFIYSDSLKLYGKLGLKEQTQIENLHNQIIGFVKIEDRFLKMIKTLVYGNRMINLSQKQKDVVLKMDTILQDMMDMVNTMFINIKEDESFKSEDYASVLISKVSEITKIKNENKLLIASQAKNLEQENRFTVFIKLMNDYERLGNYMCDIVLNSFDSRCRLVASSQTASENVVMLEKKKEAKHKRKKETKIKQENLNLVKTKHKKIIEENKKTNKKDKKVGNK